MRTYFYLNHCVVEGFWNYKELIGICIFLFDHEKHIKRIHKKSIHLFCLSVLVARTVTRFQLFTHAGTK